MVEFHTEQWLSGGVIKRCLVHYHGKYDVFQSNRKPMVFSPFCGHADSFVHERFSCRGGLIGRSSA